MTPATTANFGSTAIQVKNPDSGEVDCPDSFHFYASAASFTQLPFQPTGDYSNANGFVFGNFNPATMIDAAVVQTTKNYVRILEVTLPSTSVSIDYTMLPANSVPTGITSGDFNKDGKLDVVVNTQADSMVRILLNDGVGNLKLGGAAQLPMNGKPEAIVSADLNADGKPDVVVANRADNSITVLFGDGAGGFATQDTVTSIPDPASLSIGDLNFDGQPDIAIANYMTGGVTLLFNDQGNFQGKIAKATLGVGNLVSTVLAVDVNSDGKLDIVAAATGDNQVVVLLNMGLPSILKYTLTTEASPRSVLAGDLNGDGFPDLVVPCNGSNSVDFFLNLGGAGFMAGGTKAAFQSVQAPCTGPAQAALYDIKRDGRLAVGVLCTIGVGLLVNNSGM
jgi:hypothetical protein